MFLFPLIRAEFIKALCYRHASQVRTIISESGCLVFLIDNFLNKGVSEILTATLLKLPITEFRKRQVGWYSKHPYSYGGASHPPTHSDLPSFNKLLDECNTFFSTDLNSVMLNIYDDGTKSIPWHADDEGELGYKPTILSISLGATRNFYLRKKDNDIIHCVPLLDSSLLVMAGLTQSFYEHAVLQEDVQSIRFNLTLRHIFEK